MLKQGDAVGADTLFKRAAAAAAEAREVALREPAPIVRCGRGRGRGSSWEGAQP